MENKIKRIRKAGWFFFVLFFIILFYASDRAEVIDIKALKVLVISAIVCVFMSPLLFFWAEVLKKKQWKIK